MTLDHIVGQVVPVSILQSALRTNRMGHAYLFSGTDGLGKETVARLVARELVERGGPLSEIHVLGGEENIGIDTIRDLRNRATLKPAGYSIWIILNAERMSPEASNTLLKTLEEPPEGTFFLLTTTQPHALLSTIISRCQHLPFRRVGQKEIAQWLANRTGVEADDAKVQSISMLANGSLGKAWSYWEGSLLEERRALVSKLMAVPRSSYPEVLGMSHSWPEDRKTIARELQVFLEWHRDLFVVKNGIEVPLYNHGYECELEETSSFYTNKDLLMIMTQILRTGKAIAGNGRIRFYVGYLLLLMKKGALT
ncbi:MAG TPA: AAA family ATPase [Firmicutes bacterium]|nr:AAA family ATPase [Bacillota bacterium]